MSANNPPFNQSTMSRMSLSISQVGFKRVTTEWNTAPLHSDPFSRLYWVTQGRAWVTYRHQKRLLQPGRWYLIAAGESFCHHPPKAFEHYWLHFEIDSLIPLPFFRFFSCPFSVAEKNPRRVPDVLDRLLCLYDSNQPGDALEADGIVRQELACFVRKGSVPDHRLAAVRERLEPALTYIDQHFSEPISLATLAETVHLHPNYFSNLFTKIIGSPPRQYIVQRRVYHAQRLLWTTDTPLSVIANVIGFADECYFSRVFRKVVGIPPGAYRQQRWVLDPAQSR